MTTKICGYQTKSRTGLFWVLPRRRTRKSDNNNKTNRAPLDQPRNRAKTPRQYQSTRRSLSVPQIGDSTWYCLPRFTQPSRLHPNHQRTEHPTEPPFPPDSQLRAVPSVVHREKQFIGVRIGSYKIAKYSTIIRWIRTTLQKHKLR